MNREGVIETMMNSGIDFGDEKDQLNPFTAIEDILNLTKNNTNLKNDFIRVREDENPLYVLHYVYKKFKHHLSHACYAEDWFSSGYYNSVSFRASALEAYDDSQKWFHSFSYFRKTFKKTRGHSLVQFEENGKQRLGLIIALFIQPFAELNTVPVYFFSRMKNLELKKCFTDLTVYMSNRTGIPNDFGAYRVNYRRTLARAKELCKYSVEKKIIEAFEEIYTEAQVFHVRDFELHDIHKEYVGNNAVHPKDRLRFTLNIDRYYSEYVPFTRFKFIHPDKKVRYNFGKAADPFGITYTLKRLTSLLQSVSFAKYSLK